MKNGKANRWFLWPAVICLFLGGGACPCHAADSEIVEEYRIREAKDRLPAFSFLSGDEMKLEKPAVSSLGGTVSPASEERPDSVPEDRLLSPLNGLEGSLSESHAGSAAGELDESAPAESAESSSEEELAEWTVMFYFCPSIRESKSGLASDYINEINTCSVGGREGSQNAEDKEKIHILLETGGCASWDTEKTGIGLSGDRIQRWSYRCYGGGAEDSGGRSRFTLKEELPAANMADPETLSDFIRWGAKTAPARKYALVLWGQGGGSRTGIFEDELFGNDIMYLDELGRAVEDGGVPLEMMVFEASMMATLETAYAIREHVSWMVASEEIMVTEGTAVGAWLNMLLDDPRCSGESLGRAICDMTQISYTDRGLAEASAVLTLSLVRLDQIGRVAELFDRFFQILGEYYMEDIPRLAACLNAFHEAEEYGGINMLDLADIFYHSDLTLNLSADLRLDMLDALINAEEYVVRGRGRSAARGLSFCSGMEFDGRTLETYARNCMSMHYLAFLDAIHEWTVPDRVYETVERLPELPELEGYQIVINRYFDSYGIPGIWFPEETTNVSRVYYSLYRVSPQTGRTLQLGRVLSTERPSPEGSGGWVANEPMHWPAVEGIPCYIELVTEIGKMRLFDVPIAIGQNIWILRCGGDTEEAAKLREEGSQDLLGAYHIYGLWEGYDADSDMPNRNVKPLSQFTDQDYRVVYPVDGLEEREYEEGPVMPVYRYLEMKEVVMEPGNYYLGYEIEDIFGRRMSLERFMLVWDGMNLTPSADTVWDGQTILTRPTAGDLTKEDSLIPEVDFIQEGDPILEGDSIPEDDPMQLDAPMPEGVPVPEGEPVQEGVPVPENVPVPEGEPVQENVPMPEGEPVQEGVPVQEGEPLPENVLMPEGVPMQ